MAARSLRWLCALMLSAGCAAPAVDEPLSPADLAPPAPASEVEPPSCTGPPCDSRTPCADGERCVVGACFPDRGDCTDERDCQEDSRCYEGACVPWARCAGLLPYDPGCREGRFSLTAMPAPERYCRFPDGNFYSSPMVADLDGDGRPEIISIAFPNRLLALRGRDCSLLWERKLPLLADGQGSVAIADLDGDGAPELVTVDAEQRVLVFDRQGMLLARAGEPIGEKSGWGHEVWSAPAIAELDGKAPPEILVGAQVSRYLASPQPHLEVVWTRSSAAAFWGSLSTAADLDGDGRPEVITSERIYDGQSGADKTPAGLSERPFYPQVADFDLDGRPDLLLIEAQKEGQSVRIVNAQSGAPIFGPYRIAKGGWGGPAAIADFDGDGVPDFAVAGSSWLFVYALRCAVTDTSGTRPPGCHGPGEGLLWAQAISDRSSGSAGVVAFDFNEDGAAEVIHRDECWLRAYRGHDGKTLWAKTVTSSTGIELPVVADLDGDGHAELLVAADVDVDHFGACPTPGRPEAETRTPWDEWTRGILVFRDPQKRWAGARRLWTQHTYHLTHIADDLSVPLVEPPSWKSHNSFRQAALGLPVATRPQTDLTLRKLAAALPRDCNEPWTLRAEICNRGTLPAEPGIATTFYDGSPLASGAPACVATTLQRLRPGQCEAVSCLWVKPPAKNVELHARAGDDGRGTRETAQCRSENDRALPIAVSCFNAPP